MTTALIKLVGRELARALPSAGATEAATLIRSTPTSRTAGELSRGMNPTETSYPCKGFVSNEHYDQIGDTLVQQNDRVVCLLGEGLGVTPRFGDKLTIDGVTQRIQDVAGTPSMWILLLRG